MSETAIFFIGIFVTLLIFIGVLFTALELHRIYKVEDDD